MLFNVANDSPTLTGAKVTFTIDLEFPHKQKVLPGGDVVWAEDCTVNGETNSHTLSNTFLYSLYEGLIRLGLYFRVQMTKPLNRHEASQGCKLCIHCSFFLFVCLFVHSHDRHSHSQEQSTASLSQFTPPRTLTGRLCFLMGHQLRRIKSQITCLCGRPGVSEAVALTHTYMWFSSRSQGLFWPKL